MTVTSPARSPRQGFTLVELLIVIGVVVVLIAMLLPAVGMVRDRARSTNCQSNLTELGIAFAKANSQSPTPLRAFSTSTDWTATLPQFLDGDSRLLYCPNDLHQSAASSYGMNHRVHRMQSGDGEKVVMLDYHQTVVPAVESTPLANWPDQVAPRHRGKVNLLKYGGTVTSTDPDAIDPRECKSFVDDWRPMRDFAITLDECPEYDSNASGGTAGTGGGTGGTGGGGDDDDDDIPVSDGQNFNDPADDPNPVGCPGGLGYDHSPGMIGEWRAGIDPGLTGPILATRRDPNIHYPYGTGDAPEAPQKHLYWKPNPPFTPHSQHTVVYRAQIWISEAGDYTFHMSYDDATTLIVDNQTVFAATGHTWSNYIREVGTVTLSANRWVDIEIININYAGPSQMRCRWEYGGHPQHDLPDCHFRTP